MASAPNENGVQSMRYVLLIDEAHVIFKVKKAQDLLEKMLREIRSKGVSIILLSQGIEEFVQPSFDFSSMCETAFMFDIKDKANTKMINKFMGFSDGTREANRLRTSLEQIQRHQLISNLKEVEAGKLIGI
jgi:DNA sulfur modification protein DndE